MENSPLLPPKDEEDTLETRDYTDTQEKQPLLDVDQKSDITSEKEEAQQADEKKNTKKRRRRRLLWGLTGLALLAPVAFLGVRHLRHHHCRRYHGPPDDEIMSNFSTWLDSDDPTLLPEFPSFSESSFSESSRHRHHHPYHGYNHFVPESHPSPLVVPEPPAQLPFHQGEETSKHHHHHHSHHHHHHHHHHPQCTAKVAHDASGTYIVDPAEFSTIKLLVKAKGSHVHLIVEQDEEEDLLKRKAKRGDDDDDDNDDKIRIQAKIFVDNERTRDKLQVSETLGNGSYSWQLQGAGKSHKWHHRRRHHRPCIKAFIRIRIPAGLQDLDSLLIGAPRGFIGSKNIKDVQFGQFKAALGFGVLHFSQVRAVSVLGLANIHGAVFLNESLADAIALHTVSGLVHLTTSEAQNATLINSLGGKLFAGKIKTPIFRAHSVRGIIGIHGALADIFQLSTTTGTIFAGVHATSGFYARSLAGSIHAYVHYGDKDDDSDDYKKGLEYFGKHVDDKDVSSKHEPIPDDLRREWQKDDIIKEGDPKWPSVLAKSLKGLIHLAIAEGYEGRFQAASVIRRVEVDGDDVEFEKDNPHFKSGWVQSNDEGAPLVVGKSVGGAVKLRFL